MTHPRLLLGLLGVGALAAVLGGDTHRSGPPMAWEAFEALCAQWAKLWGLPVEILEVVGKIESSLRPGMSNTLDPRAVGRGGSWGLFGMTEKTAADLLAKHPPLAAQPAAQAWNGSGASLHDPTLAAMLASFYLSTLWNHYKAFLPTVAAYQQGTTPVDAVLARGGNLATDLPTHGRDYVAKAMRALSELPSRASA